MHEKLTVKPYIIGFVLSLLLTFGAFFIVNQHVSPQHMEFSHTFIIMTILILAIAQLLVQLFFFLHMGREQKPRWNMAVFLSFISLILMIVIASIWIMYHLNYNMSPMDMQNQLLDEEHMQMPGMTLDGKGHLIRNSDK